MSRDWELTRRKLLAGAGTAGVGVGAVTTLAGTSRAYTHYTYAGDGDPRSISQDEGDLRVAWWATRNGQVVDTQGTGSANASTALDDETAPAYVADAPGPVLRATNVLPGDKGRLAIGVQPELPEDETIAVWYRARIVSKSENGVNEPERAAGDDPDRVELLDRTQVTVWEDTGAVGTGTVGACDGRLTPGDESPVPGGDGSLREVGSALSAGRRFGNCLEDGDTRCLGLKWALPATGSDINVVQSDSATFSLEFHTAPCEDGDNPFDRGGSNE